MNFSHILVLVFLFTAQADHRLNLQKFLDGIFEQNQLQSPQSALSCFDDDTIKLLFTTFTDFFDTAINVSYQDATYLDQLIIVALGKVPQDQADCFVSNPAFNQLSLAYEMGPNYPYNPISKVNLHFKYNWVEASPNFNVWYSEWESQEYQDTGYDIAEFMHQILP